MRIITTKNSSSSSSNNNNNNNSSKLEGNIDVCMAVNFCEGHASFASLFCRQRVSYRESGASKSSLCDVFGSNERATVVLSSREEAGGGGGGASAAAAAGKIRQDAPL